MTRQLDAGIEEKVMLVSRDEQSCLIVSYREVRFSFFLLAILTRGSALIYPSYSSGQELH